MGDLIYLLVGLAVIVLAVVTGLLVRSSRGQLPAPTEPPRVEAAPAPQVSSLEVPAPPLERPEATASRIARLRSRLASSQSGLGRGLLALLSRDRLDEETWESIEDTLLGADIGVAPTQQVVDNLRTRLRVEGGERPDARGVLRDELITLVDPGMDRRLQVTGAGGLPGVVLVVGVNGSGKTTTVGKLARILVAEGRSVVLGEIGRASCRERV